MEYSLLIKKYRIARNMTLEELAEKSKLSASYLSELESNLIKAKSPTLRTLFKVSEALDICPRLLISFNRTCTKDCIPTCSQNF